MTAMRTLGLILYFLLTSNGFSSDAEVISDICGSLEANSSEAMVDLSESLVSNAEVKKFKKRNNQSKKGFGQHFLPGNSQIAYAVLVDIYQQPAIESQPKLDDAYKEHTLYNNLFFPPDEDHLA